MEFWESFWATTWGALSGAMVGAFAAWLFALDLRRRDRLAQQKQQTDMAAAEVARALDSVGRALFTRYEADADGVGPELGLLPG